MRVVLAVALGGAIGAVARHVFAAQVTRFAGEGFPWGILTVNVLGSFVMGVLAEGFALRWNAPLEARAFLTVGILGGFTTFSSFSLDAMLLMERGQWVAAALYMIGSVVLAVGGLFCGLVLVRQLMS
jgi:fluoride exporter